MPLSTQASPDSWMEFSYSQTINTDFLSFRERNIPYRGNHNTGGVPAYAAIAYQIRIGQLFIENMPLYIRMATGSLGLQARNIESPPLRAVLGYDLLKLFSYVQFNFLNGTIDFDTMNPFVPNEKWLIAKTSILDEEDEGLVIEGALLERNPIYSRSSWRLSSRPRKCGSYACPTTERWRTRFSESSSIRTSATSTSPPWTLSFH